MADTRAAPNLTVKQWDDKFYTEYFQENPFEPLMGTTELDIIQVKEDLTKKKGDRIVFSLVRRLTNDAVIDDNVLEGNEEGADSRGFELRVRRRRNAVVVGEMEEQKSAIGIRDAAKPLLKDWANEDTRDLIIGAMCSINGVAYATATEAEKDAWLVDNADRVLFGAALSNNSSNDHSASLANIDNTADKCTGARLSLLKRRALRASPKIRPVRDAGNGKRYFTVYVDNFLMRDLRADAVVLSAHEKTVDERANSVIFEGGDIMWDGMIIKELDDMPRLTGVGAGGIDVGRAILMGAQAIGMGWAKRWSSKTKEFDYGDKVGTAIRGTFGVEKLRFGTGDPTETDDLIDPKDHGIATGYFASVEDA